MTKPQCACQQAGSPIKGVVWTPERRRVRRCHPCTYAPEPPFALFSSDKDAATAMQSAGYTITRAGARFIADQTVAPARKSPRTKVTDEDLRTARLEVARTRELHDEALKARQRLVKRALKQGMTPAHVARQAGVTRAAVSLMRDA